MVPLGDITNGRKLSSWKEIATRLGVTVRTAQRWEKLAGLPVHRSVGKIGRTYAYAFEIDRWLAAGRPGNGESEGQDGGAPVPRGGWALRARWLIGVAVALAAAVGGVETWLWRQAARTPVAWSLEGSKLVVRDSRGRLCWEKQFPEFNAHFAAEVRDKVTIADLDGDGRREVLFNFFPADMAHSASSLMCFEPDGRLRWEYRYGRERTFGGRHFEPDYKGALVRPVRIEGKPFVLAVANHYIWYPAQISLLDARTGRLVEEYWHPGAIYYCSLADVDGDGRNEVVFGAIDNPGQGIGHGALGVLKLPFSKAPKPTVAAGDPFPPVTGGGELAYVLFPTPDVNRVLALLPIMTELRVDRNRIFVNLPLAENGAMVYYLDFGLKVLDHRFSDNFPALHQRLCLQHLLDHRLGPGEIAEMGTVIHFGWAPDGNSPELKRFWKY
jgi:hypothetical protein